MTTTITALRAAIQVRLDTIDGLRATAEWPDQVNAPAAFPLLPEENAIEYHQAFGGTKAAIRFEVWLLAFPIDKSLKRGQEKLDTYLNVSDSLSIKAALEADQTLGGISDYILCQRAFHYGAIEANGLYYAGVKFEVEVCAAL